MVDEMVQVDGNSMKNILQNGDFVFVKKQCKVHFGDIIVFQYGNAFVIHRVIFKFYKWIVQMGDNSKRPGIIGKDSILGVAYHNITQDTQLNNKFINRKIAMIVIFLAFINLHIQSPRDIINKRIIGKIYLKILEKRNQLQKQCRNSILEEAIDETTK